MVKIQSEISHKKPKKYAEKKKKRKEIKQTK